MRLERQLVEQCYIYGFRKLLAREEYGRFGRRNSASRCNAYRWSCILSNIASSYEAPLHRVFLSEHLLGGFSLHDICYRHSE